MAIELVKTYLKQFDRDRDILELEASSATVELAAAALHTEGKRIAKSLAFMVEQQPILIVCAGDGKIDNHKFKDYFHHKAKMMKAADVIRYTNHEIGGVCPFAVPQATQVYLDVSMQRFDYVYPACGSSNSAIRCTMHDLETLIPYVAWIDVCSILKDVE